MQPGRTTSKTSSGRQVERRAANCNGALKLICFHLIKVWTPNKTATWRRRCCLSVFPPLDTSLSKLQITGQQDSVVVIIAANGQHLLSMFPALHQTLQTCYLIESSFISTLQLGDKEGV